MADYNSNYAGSTIDTAIGKVINADSAPTSGSEELVKSGGVKAALDLKAPLASPAFTGNPTATTQAAGNNSNRIATTAFVQNGLATKQDALTFDSTPRANSSNPVTSSGIKAAIDAVVIDNNGLAPINSPAFTGAPTAPTPASGDNTTRISTTAFVQTIAQRLDENLADEFDVMRVYNKDDYALRGGRIYRFKNDSVKLGYKDTNDEVFKDADGKVYLANQNEPWRSGNIEQVALANEVSRVAHRIPDAPTTDGEYTLKVTVADGVSTFTWE